MTSPLDNQQVARRRPPEKKGPRVYLILALLLGAGAISIAAIQAAPEPEQNRSAVVVVNTPVEVSAPANRLTVNTHTIARGETIQHALFAMELTSDDVNAVIASAKEHTNLSRVRPGLQLVLFREHGVPVSVQFHLTRAKTLLATRSRSWSARVHEVPYETQLVTFQGQVESTLWESALEAGMDANLIAELAEVFAWQVDFGREVYRGDRFRLAVEQKTLRGDHAGWGRIQSAEYINNAEAFTAIWFVTDDEKVRGYFQPDGNSMRRMFLRSPVRYSRISSRYSRSRYHPVLKKRRPHYGVDYAAAPGTPIRAVGDGTIEYAGLRGGAGKHVKIRHNSTYQTSYSHLRGYAKGVRKGTKVKQGQVIGYIGSTGLATGPHLHFSFYENGRYVDPLGRKFPSADPVPNARKAEFSNVIATQVELLPEWTTPSN